MSDKEFYLVNCDIYTGDEVLVDYGIHVQGDRIVSLVKDENIPGDAECINLEGKIVAPGFIDVQVNGGGGVLFNDSPSLDALKTIAAAHERFGVLNFCPTIISTDTSTIKKCLDSVGVAQESGIGVLGAHLEGPFIEKSKAGIHDEKYIRVASDSEVAEIIRYRKAVCIFTVAPEAISNSQIENIVRSGINVFIGHTNAKCTEVLDLFRYGAKGVTHLFNAMSQLNSREPGGVGASFYDTSSWAGIIVDGYHVDYKAVQIAKHIKGKKLILVTDAMPPVGQPDARYRIGEHEIACINGRCATKDGTLAGSALDMATAIRNAVQKCGIPLDEAIRMATAYVAEMLGIDDALGYIKPGMFADLVVMNGQVQVEAIVRRGVYSKFTSDNR